MAGQTTETPRLSRRSTPGMRYRRCRRARRSFSLGAAPRTRLDPRPLDPSFAGRPYDEQLLAELPPRVDRCGENGEFHTFVHAGPIFVEPIGCKTGEIVERDGFVFCDLTPA